MPSNDIERNDAGPSTRPQPRSRGNCHDPPKSDDYDYIQEFFQYRPQTLRKAAGHTSSTETRPPGYFDRHLAPELQLMHVVYLPSILGDLMKIADDALEAACLKGTLPPRPGRMDTDFPTNSVREDALRGSSSDAIICEQQIESVYAATTATFCLRVAGALAFQLPAWEPGYLRYTLERDHTHAIADGFLKLDKIASTKEAPPLSADHCLVADKFPTLAIWEFKSLAAGTIDVMEAIVQQAANCLAFDWEGCEFGKACIGKHKGGNGRPVVTGSRMGFDAETPPYSSLVARKPRSPTSPLTAHSRTCAAHITQQTWAEAVHDDATFVIIHAGNLEIIGKRHRCKRTLYVSDVIRVDLDPDYGKLHTGLYIAALRDASRRALQLEALGEPLSWTASYGKNSSVVAKLDAANILAQACARDWLVLRSGRGNSTFIPFIPNVFHIRDNPSKPFHKQTDLTAFFKIRLDAQFQPFIAKGTMSVDENQFKGIKNAFSKTVVVKFAHTEDTIRSLRHEHDVYLELLKAGVTGVPRIIGIFTYADVEQTDSTVPYAVLVMEDMGQPVEYIPGELTRNDLNLFERLLKSIHNAGFVHGKLSRNNLMISGDTLGRVSIVSFGSAYRPSQSQATVFGEEYKSLSKLLPNPLKKTVDGKPTDSFKESSPDDNIHPSGVPEDEYSPLVSPSTRKKARTTSP